MHRPYILFLLAAALATAAPAAGIYEVSRDGRTLFLLGGTIHALPADERTLPQPYAEALQQADALCLETDMVALESPAFVSEMFDAFQYDDGQSLQSSLGAAAYESLSDHSERYGIPIASMEPFKPGFALLTIELTHYIRMGMSPPGLDQLLQNQAIEQGKALCPLETPEQQLEHLLAAIGNMSDADVIQAVEQSRAQGDDWLQSFLDKWRRGRHGGSGHHGAVHDGQRRQQLSPPDKAAQRRLDATPHRPRADRRRWRQRPAAPGRHAPGGVHSGGQRPSGRPRWPHPAAAPRRIQSHPPLKPVVPPWDCANCGMLCHGDHCPKCDADRWHGNHGQTLHCDIAHYGQTLAEAETELQEAIHRAQREQYSHLRLITGRSGPIQQAAAIRLQTMRAQGRIRNYHLQNPGCYQIRL